MRDLDEYEGGSSSELALLLVNDCEPDEKLDAITRDAAKFFKVPIAMINLVTSDEILFKACVGRPQGGKLNRSGMFCSYAVMQDEPLVVVDALADEFFRNTPLVTGPLKIRSYAGKSLCDTKGEKIGTLCLFDIVPRDYTAEQLQALTCMAEMVEEQLARIVHSNSPVALA